MRSPSWGLACFLVRQGTGCFTGEVACLGAANKGVELTITSVAGASSAEAPGSREEIKEGCTSAPEHP